MDKRKQLDLNGKTRKIKTYGLDFGQRGVYDTRNPLNDLTGKEWTHFINSVHVTDFASRDDEFQLWKFLQDSVIQTRYSTNGEDSHGHNLRRAHPSPKPPQLMRDIIAFFTKKDGWVLDPFMGVGGTLLGAALLDPPRNVVGLDLSKKYIEIYKNAAKQEKLKEQTTIVGDARELCKFKEISNKKFDLILTDPPYANMMSRLRTGGSSNKGIGISTPFTNDKRDVGNLDYFDYLLSLREIIENTMPFLKEKGYLVMFCKDMQPNKQHHNLLHADIIQELSKIAELQFKGYKIWYDKTINLYPYGYPFSFVANQLHQFILIFRKESKK